jgi:uncharacterized membrane protein
MKQESTGNSSEAEAPARVVERNIQALIDMRNRHAGRRTVEERVADAITTFIGSMGAVYLHAAFFGAWIIINAGVFDGIAPFDPYPFVMLAMFASVEAIFLSTFVLISQNRQAQMAQKRDDLDLQINLLAEHEITSVLLLLDELAKRLDVPRHEQRTEELKKDAGPEVVLASLERAERET